MIFYKTRIFSSENCPENSGDLC